jgi:dihydrodipicolinate synthase/N-acetylneuraminate lyase
MKVLGGLLVLALCACSTPKDVFPTGKDAYVVRPFSWDASTDPEIKAYGIRRAAEYCDETGKHAVVTVGTTGGVQMFSVQRAEVRFNCIDK